MNNNCNHNIMQIAFFWFANRPKTKMNPCFVPFVIVTGYGMFHYKLLALCGWALSSDAIEVLAISFILPPATCDLGLSNSDKGLLNSSVFCGMYL